MFARLIIQLGGLLNVFGLENLFSLEDLFVVVISCIFFLLQIHSSNVENSTVWELDLVELSMDVCTRTNVHLFATFDDKLAGLPVDNGRNGNRKN